MKKEDLMVPGGADIGVTFCGYTLKSPFILSSGPLSYGAAGLIRASEAGAGAVVTKTIRLDPAVNPVPHIRQYGPHSLINAEKWSDLTWEDWCSREIPEAVSKGVVVIASVGHTPEESHFIVPRVAEAGAQMIELVSYTEDTMLPMLDDAKRQCDLPVICKISGNWPDPVGAADRCLRHGADGICAIDSIGPVLKIDIRKASPVLASEGGYGWLTGEAIRPISMRINCEIAKRHPDLSNLYASGGVMRAEDAVEFLMAGAAAFGICTSPMLNGVSYITRLGRELSRILGELGYRDLSEARGAALAHMPEKERTGRLCFHFQPYREDGTTKQCVSCHKCEQVCSYQARKLDFPVMTVDEAACRSCGLCVDACPTGALTASYPEA